MTEDVHLDVVRADVDVILGSPVRTLVHDEPLLGPLQLVAQTDRDDLKCRDIQDQSIEVTSPGVKWLSAGLGKY